MNQKYFFREFQNSDQDQVYTLILSILESEFEDIPPEDFLKDVENIQGNYNGSGSCFFVCECEGQIVGTIGVVRDDEKTALFRRFFVNPNYRGKQIGGRLLEKAVDFCKEHDYKTAIFIGNNRFHKVKRIFSHYNFSEVEDLFFKAGGLELFKLERKI